jgi:hypothetical protein
MTSIVCICVQATGFTVRSDSKFGDDIRLHSCRHVKSACDDMAPRVSLSILDPQVTAHCKYTISAHCVMLDHCKMSCKIYATP